MAKQGMKRPEITDKKEKNTVQPVPEINGKAKHTKQRANPIIEGVQSAQQKVYHTTPYAKENPISPVYSTIDTDLARDNLENDITAADLQDL